MKRQVGTLDAVPSKRILQSIIADYDLNRSVCELVDNALDVWHRNERKKILRITVELNLTQQTILVHDNAGGVRESELSVIVGPGQTANAPSDDTIGFFGVGNKRAVVALAEYVMITSRHAKDPTFRVEFDDSWLADDSDWSLPYYEVDSMEPDTTIIELHKLREKLTLDGVQRLKEHLGATYAKFLSLGGVAVSVNGEDVSPVTFENWAYPSSNPPQRYISQLEIPKFGQVEVDITAGLVNEWAGQEYGVYFYCNDRLIARSLQSYEVGFGKGLAGIPHPSISIVRMIVSLHGHAIAMPWNSSKSDINPNHATFKILRDPLVKILKHATSLSRSLVSDWKNKVFAHKTGVISVHRDFDLWTGEIVSPSIPAWRPRYSKKVKDLNLKLSKEKPWVTGLCESMIATDMIFKQKWEQKNRICLILLDSTIEIGFKEYLVNGSGQSYRQEELLRLFANRNSVTNEVTRFIEIKNKTKRKIDYYYNLRNKLIHEKASVGISDTQIKDYRDVVQKMLRRMFGIRFSK
jgi:hypothetical protein